jgi:hypothetical protein
MKNIVKLIGLRLDTSTNFAHDPRLATMILLLAKNWYESPVWYLKVK